MDVVGSYTGIIGLDGLSLAGNEYSADRYLSEMQGWMMYMPVAARINQASTREKEKSTQQQIRRIIISEMAQLLRCHCICLISVLYPKREMTQVSAMQAITSAVIHQSSDR